MNVNIAKAKQQLAALHLEAQQILAGADASTGAISEEGETRFKAIELAMKNVEVFIARQETLDASAQAGASATVQPVQFGQAARVTDNIENDPRRGFAGGFGEFCHAVIGATVNPGRVDRRLARPEPEAAAPTTFGGESSGSDGGFLVPPEFGTDIFTHSLEGQSLLPLTDNTTIRGNSMTFPKDETTPWGTDGVRSYWQAEAVAATATKPKLSTSTLRLQKLMSLVPLTDELIEDAGALGQYLTKKTGDSIRWKTNEAILYGTGNGTPLGLLKGNAAITVPKTGSQYTNTLTALNLANMIARLPEGSFGRAIWLINNDVLPALFTLTLGNYPIYMPINSGVQDNPYGMLLGRPVMVTQHANTFSALGDVQLHDLSFYRTITKNGGVQTATSMHLYFDADATAFRTTFRIGGEPSIVNPIAPARGSNNMSPFLQLEAR